MANSRAATFSFSPSPSIGTTLTTASSPSRPSSDILKDIFLWRGKKLSAVVLLLSTATWVMLKIYRFNFIPLACWVAMFTIASMFLSGNLARLFHKKIRTMSRWEVSDQSTIETQNGFQGLAEEVIRWMFKVGVEEKWSVFIEMFAGLWVLSLLSGLFDFLTFSYIGVLWVVTRIVMGMTIPFIYFKCESSLKGIGERMGRRMHQMVEDMFLGEREYKHR